MGFNTAWRALCGAALVLSGALTASTALAETYEDKLVAADPQAGARFGTGVSIHGDLAVIGASLDDSAATDAGSA